MPISSAPMRFEKWQAAGNAYLVIERGDLSAALTPRRVVASLSGDSAFLRPT